MSLYHRERPHVLAELPLPLLLSWCRVGMAGVGVQVGVGGCFKPPRLLLGCVVIGPMTGDAPLLC
jgi:hypothetical protein